MDKAPLTALALAFLLSQSALVHAGHPLIEDRVDEVEAVIEESPFDRGSLELQVLGGAFFSINHSPDFNYAIGTVRLGCMLYSPKGEGCLRGNTELLLEVFGGGIFEGPGSGLVGGTLLLRYNFVQPEAAVVPYLQIGAGGLYSDAADDETQRLIGSDFEFNLQASIGVRWFCTPRCALTLEGGYRHISNADTADRNVGVDSIGGMIGVSYFF